MKVCVEINALAHGACPTICKVMIFFFLEMGEPQY